MKWGKSAIIMVGRKEKEWHHTILSSLALSVTQIWSQNRHSGCVNDREHKERKGGKKKKDNHLLFQYQLAAWWKQGPESACGSSQGTEAFIRASLTKAIWRDYGRFTVFSAGPVGGPWKLFNWEISESGCGIEQCFVSEGEGSLAHQQWSHKARFQRNSDTNLLAQWHTYSHWARRHKPYKGGSKFVCRVPISISGFLIRRRKSDLGGPSLIFPWKSNPFTLRDATGATRTISTLEINVIFSHILVHDKKKHNQPQPQLSKKICL